jgi:hypothetical protein
VLQNRITDRDHDEQESDAGALTDVGVKGGSHYGHVTWYKESDDNLLVWANASRKSGIKNQTQF